MKKLLSLALTVLLIASTVITPLSVSAETTDYVFGNELVTNGDFSASTTNTLLTPVCGNNTHTIAEYISITPNHYSKWIRPTGGVAFASDAYANQTATPSAEGEYPVYFKQNDTVLAQPDDSENNVLRVVQSAMQYVDATANATYKVSFKYRLGGQQDYYSSATTAKKQIKIYLSAFTPVKSNGVYTDKISSSAETLIPIKSDGFSSTCDDTVAVSNGSIFITATPDDKWHTAELTFTTGERNLNTTADYDEDANGTIDASLLPMLTFYQEIGSSITLSESNYIQNAFYLDDVSLKEVTYLTNVIGNAEFCDAKGTKISNSNEIAKISKVVNGNSVTATANNDLESGLTFIGWYKNGELYSNNQTITVAIGDEVYIPHYKSVNLLASSASFENIEANTSMRYIEYHPADDETPNYPEGNLWGIAAVNGYLTYESAEKLTSQRVATYAEDIYAADGTKATQTYSYRNVGNWTSYTNGVTVVSGDAHTGNNALQIINADMTYAMGLDVNPNTEYTLTYYVKDATANVTTTKGYGSAILSTINISAGVHSSGGGQVAIAANLPEHVFGGNQSGAVPYTLASNKMSDVPDTWTKVEHKFNSGMHEKLYFTVGNRNSRGTYVLLDDIVLTQEAKELEATATATVAFVDQKGNDLNDTNSYSNITVTPNEDGTNTLTIDYSKDLGTYTFLGWYDTEGNQVCEDETFNNASEGEYIAKIKNSNMMPASSFEGYDANASLKHTDSSVDFATGALWGGQASAGYCKRTVAGTVYNNQGTAYTQTASGSFSNGITATVSENFAHSGKKSLYLSQQYWASITAIENVKPGKEYTLSYWVKRDPTQSERTKLKTAAVVTTVNVGTGGATGVNQYLCNYYNTYGLELTDGKNSLSNIDLSSDNWVQVNMTFTVPEAATNLNTVYLALDSSGSDSSTVIKFYIDDLTVTEHFDGIKTAYNSAAALRTAEASSTGKNGMRIYNKIELDYIEQYGIKEYGSVAILNSNLDGELTLDTENIVKGVAYNAETKPNATLFDQTETANIYTSYLSNIPEKRYDEQYVIRAYAIDNTGSVYYGESIAVSVYDVALAIDNDNSVSEQTQNDINAFKYFAGGKDGNFTMYDNWLKTSELKFAGKLRNIEKAEDTLSGDALTTALEVDGYYEPFFERAIANVGNRALLKAMFEKAQRGEDITVVGFGGSITQKAACTNELDSYSHLVAAWLREQFPDITVNWYNAGIGSTTSVLGIARMQDHVLAYNPDLVLLDFTTNDQTNDYHAGSYESILRTLYEKEIAVVTIAFGNVNNNEYNNNGVCLRGTNREDLHGPVMLYNDVPVIDYYGVMWDCYLDADGDGYNEDSDAAHWKTLWNDYIHPTKIGHKLAGNAINYYLGKVLDDLDNITEEATCPATPYDKYTEYFMGSMMYGEANIGDLLTDSSNVTIGTYSNYDSTTVSNWTIWQIEEGGYVEFTIDKCKMFALMSINCPEAPVAKIYVNGTLAATHTASRSSGNLNWMNFIKFYDGSETVTVKIECTSGSYRITSALIAK